MDAALVTWSRMLGVLIFQGRNRILGIIYDLVAYFRIIGRVHFWHLLM